MANQQPNIHHQFQVQTAAASSAISRPSAFDDDAFKICSRAEYDDEPGLTILLAINRGQQQHESIWPRQCDSRGHRIVSCVVNLSKRKVARENDITVQSLLMVYHCLDASRVRSQQQHYHDASMHCGRRFMAVRFVEGLNAAADDDFVERVLRRGIQVSWASNRHERFNVVGMSNSQLRAKSFYFMRGSQIDIAHWTATHLINESALNAKSAAKLVKHRGLLFSSCRYVLDLPDDTMFVQLDDVVRNGFTFTDGCGTISALLARRLAKQARLPECPSVWQIRYCGFGRVYKGVVVVDHGHSMESQHAIGLRPSMAKLITVDESGRRFSPMDIMLRYKLGVLDYGRPHTVGKLNSQIATLLSATVPESDMLALQAHMLACVKDALHDPVAALYCCALVKRTNVFVSLLELAAEAAAEQHVRMADQGQYQDQDHQSQDQDQDQDYQDQVPPVQDQADQDQNQNQDQDQVQNEAQARRQEKEKVIWLQKSCEGTCSQAMQMLRSIQRSLVPCSSSSSSSVKKQIICSPLLKLTLCLGFSRRLFGVSFPEQCSHILPAEHCYVSYLSVSGEIEYLTGEVLVCRTPSYSPGDVRVLTALPIPEDASSLRKLHDVIIFSCEGDRPEADKMSGGDLDGDQYVVIWDPRLLAYAATLRRPLSRLDDDDDEFEISTDEDKKDKQEDENYDQSLDSGSAISNDWISYAARWDQKTLAMTDFAFRVHASRAGVSSPECRRLATIFGRSVDQHSADLRQLKRLYEEARAQFVSMVSRGSFTDGSRTGSAPVWEKMAQRQAVLGHQIVHSSKSDQHQRDLQAWAAFVARLKRMNASSGMIQSELDEDALFGCVRDLLPAGFWSECEHHLRSIASTDVCPELTMVPLPVCHRNDWNIFFDVKGAPGSAGSQAATSVVDAGNVNNDTLVARASFRSHWRSQVLQAIKEIAGHYSSAFRVYSEQRNQMIYSEHELQQRNIQLDQHELILKQTQSRLASQQDIIQKAKSALSRMHGIVGALKRMMTSSKRMLKAHESSSLLEFRDALRAWEAHDLDEMLQALSELSRQGNVVDTACQDIASAFDRQLRRLISDEITRFNSSVYTMEDVTRQYRRQFRQRIATWLKRWIPHSMLPNGLEASTALIEQVTRDSEERAVLARSGVAEVIRTLEQRVIPTFDSYQGSAQDAVITGVSVANSCARLCQHWQTSVLKTKNLVDQARLQRHCFGKAIEALLKDNGYDDDDEYNSVRASYLPKKLWPALYRAEVALMNEIEWASGDIVSAVADRHRNRSAAERVDVAIRKEVRRFRGSGGEQRLPILSVRDVLSTSLSHSNCVVLSAATGSGKSTQVPQFLADDWLIGDLRKGGERRRARIVCTQPRRVAATQIAKRVLAEYTGRADAADSGEDLSDDEGDNASINRGEGKCRDDDTGANVVGYRVGRLRNVSEDHPMLLLPNHCVSANTRIEFVTEGVLLHDLRMDASLRRFDVVIIDEVHERAEDTDVIMALLRRTLRSQKRRCHLRVVVMSASIDVNRFASYFGDENDTPCPIITCAGRAFPVHQMYSPGPLAILTSRSKQPPRTLDVVNTAVELLFEVIIGGSERGDVLIFFSGMSAILMCVQQIEMRYDAWISNMGMDVDMEGVEQLKVYPLWAALPHDQQTLALAPIVPKDEEGSRYTRKVVCCTNVAETSLTISGVRFVIDSGCAKKIGYDPELLMSCLREEYISEASSKQRAGRAGRVESGFCFKLYSEGTLVKQFDPPKILQCPVQELILYLMYTVGVSRIQSLGLMDCPSEEAILSGTLALLDLGFIQSSSSGGIKYELTHDGEIAVHLVADFCLESIRMILAAREYGCVYQALLMAAGIAAGPDLFLRGDPRNLSEYAEFLDELGDFFTFHRVVSSFMSLDEGGRGTDVIHWLKPEMWQLLRLSLLFTSCQ